MLCILTIKNSVPKENRLYYNDPISIYLTEYRKKRHIVAQILLKQFNAIALPCPIQSSVAEYRIFWHGRRIQILEKIPNKKKVILI